MNSIQVDNIQIGPGFPTFVIAEIGINHNGDPELAKELIAAASKTGANAVKFQTFRTSEFISRSNPFFDLFRKCELKPETFEILHEYANQSGIVFLSTPFDFESVEVLERLSVPGFKVASCDLTNIPLLRCIARKGKPILLSTGMGTQAEIFIALETMAKEGNEQIALLHCISNYPTKPSQVNLRAIPRMAEVFDCPVGLSDHTLGTDIPVASVVLGASLLEKHFTLDKTMEGPDHQLSADPDDLKRIIKAIRQIEPALGSPKKRPVETSDHIALLRRSLVARMNIPHGTVIASDMIAIKRPGTGLQPAYIDQVVGRRTKLDIKEDSLIRWDDLD